MACSFGATGWLRHSFFGAIMLALWRVPLQEDLLCGAGLVCCFSSLVWMYLSLWHPCLRGAEYARLHVKATGVLAASPAIHIASACGAHRCRSQGRSPNYLARDCDGCADCICLLPRCPLAAEFRVGWPTFWALSMVIALANGVPRLV